jgi:quercetin dioxygenase-like cupin family protein
MRKKTKVAISVAACVLMLLVGSAFALSNIALRLGTVSSYDFGGDIGSVPATVQIHVFTMKPGDTIPWHYHKGPSYVILARGHLTETHYLNGQCGSEQVNGGDAFVEPPGLQHTITNTGNEEAVIWWSTVFPKSDGIMDFAPSFKVGGVYPVPTPNCN